MKTMLVELKGSTFTLLVLHLKNYPLELVKKEILGKIKKFPMFFKNAPIAINVKEITNEINWDNLKNIIFSCGLHIIGVSGCNNKKLRNSIVQSGLPILSESKELFNYCKNTELDSKILSRIQKKYNKTQTINLPIRSGQKIYANYSDLIIVNNVNAGAEVIADGNVHIYGEVRGRVLAGAKGDDSCQIFCTKFFSELIAISGQYLLSEQFPAEIFGNSVRIHIKNQKLNITKLS